MPLYDYECPICKEIGEYFQKMGDDPPGHCNHCGAIVVLNKKISSSSFRLKGGGWHKDLYSSSPPKKES